MNLIQKFIKHPKIISLFISIAVFSIIYLLLDDNHFSGVNYIKEKIKEEVIKKKVEKEIDEGDPEVLESFTGFNYNNVEQTLDETTKDVKQEIKDKELVSEKIDVPLSQKFFNRIYFSISTGTLLGYGDIYPTTNICKLIAMVQSLFTIALIVY
jgi:hypothetical protein